jgi:hypothetical protein
VQIHHPKIAHTCTCSRAGTPWIFSSISQQPTVGYFSTCENVVDARVRENQGKVGANPREEEKDGTTVFLPSSTRENGGSYCFINFKRRYVWGKVATSLDPKGIEHKHIN